MESNSDPKNIIGELKVAGEEVKKASFLNISQEKEISQNPRESRRTQKENLEPKTIPSLAKVLEKTGVVMEGKEEVDLLKKIAEYQKEISQEQSGLEKKLQKVQELEKKLREKIELFKNLQIKSAEINKELKEFQEQLILVKKENIEFLNPIKNELGKENDPSVNSGSY